MGLIEIAVNRNPKLDFSVLETFKLPHIFKVPRKKKKSTLVLLLGWSMKIKLFLAAISNESNIGVFAPRSFKNKLGVFIGKVRNLVSSRPMNNEEEKAMGLGLAR